MNPLLRVQSKISTSKKSFDLQALNIKFRLASIRQEEGIKYEQQTCHQSS